MNRRRLNGPFVRSLRDFTFPVSNVFSLEPGSRHRRRRALWNDPEFGRPLFAEATIYNNHSAGIQATRLREVRLKPGCPSRGFAASRNSSNFATARSIAATLVEND